ncbi:AraC family transcriptional regulator [Nocardia arizonensis]|uniref:AraC family transcriptional regulator n=1 Tax=Nocardia arizonensis TaxID=1141647 RepID=UPI00194E1AB7|nr:AraC family transcriptional regulator [Nocardia arizonensis]
MDPLSYVLGGIRAEGAMVGQAVLKAPWTIRFVDRAPLTMVTVLRGDGTLVLADGAERPLRAGDTAIVRGPAPFELVDRPDSPGRVPAEYEIACFVDESDCVDAEAGEIDWEEESALATTTLIIAAYRASGHRHERLLRALPTVAVVSAEQDETCAWLEAAASEAATRSAGSQAMLDRLLDWGLVCTLRAWFTRAGADAPEWFQGLSDPVVALGLEAIHSRPTRAWTVAALAERAGVSRALFAKRFTAVMGRPPLTYLTEIRMDEAAALLLDTDLTVARIARTVGYADAFGFSAAFKRHKGMSPTAFRTAA